MQKVLHIINGEHFAGAERVQDLLALNLATHGFQADFVCLKPGVFEKNRTSTTFVHNLPMKSAFDLRAAFKLAKLAKDGGYSLLHTHGTRSILIGAIASRLTNVPFVHHAHSPTARDTENSRRNAINAGVEDWCMNGAAAVIAVSGSMQDYVQSRACRIKRLVTIPNGITAPATVKHWAKPNGPWVIGCAALFRPRKGLDVLLDAAKRLKEKGADFRLRLIGGFETPQYENEIRARATANGIDSLIDWVGFTRDVEGEMAKLNLFILPSLYGEGLPMVLLEAMGQGLPVIASAIDGVPEVLSAPNSGLLVQAGDATALGTAIYNLMNNPTKAAHLALGARVRQQSRYAADGMAEQVSRIYREVVQVVQRYSPPLAGGVRGGGRADNNPSPEKSKDLRMQAQDFSSSPARGEGKFL